MLKEVNWLLGEIIGSADLIAMQRLASAKLQDALIARRMNLAGSELGAAGSDVLCWSYGPGASPVPGSNVREVTNLSGTVAQQITFTPDGLTPKTLVGLLAAGDLLTTLDAGHATQPRIDSIFFKLSEVLATANGQPDWEDRAGIDSNGNPTTISGAKKLRVVVTKTVSKGVEDGSLAVPATPAGYMRWADIYVPATWNTFLAYENIRDQRWPLTRGMAPEIHLPQRMWLGTGWSINSDNEANTSTNNALAYATVEGGYVNARLAGIEAYGVFTANIDVHLVRRYLGDYANPPTDTVLQDVSASFRGVSGVVEVDLTAAAIAPCWLNGHRTGQVYNTGSISPANTGKTSVLALRFTAKDNPSVTKIRYVRFRVAC